MALSNPVTIYLALKGVSLLMPVGAFRLAFTNGLMSEAMFLWFLSMLCVYPPAFQNLCFFSLKCGTIKKK